MRVFAADDGKPADIVSQHARERFKYIFIGIANHKRTRAGFKDGLIAAAFEFKHSQQVTLRDHAGELTTLVDNWQSMMAREIRIARCDAVRGFRYLHLRWNCWHVGKH